MRVQLAELRSENKLLNRDLDKTRRMSAVLLEELSQQVVHMDRVSTDDDSDDSDEEEDSDEPLS